MMMKLQKTNKKTKTLLFALIFTLLLGLTSTAMAGNSQSFTDVKAGDWFYNNIKLLVEKDGINGNPDGSFKPNDNITNAEFIKIVVGSTLGKQANAPTDKHWAANYMEVAFENQLIDENFANQVVWDTPMTRQNMAVVVTNTLTNVLKEEPIADTTKFVARIKDWDTGCETRCKPMIAQAYAKGIINGNPDGSFKGDAKATRAEATTMIVRLIMADQRVDVTKVEEKPVSKVNTVTENDWIKGYTDEFHNNKEVDYKAYYCKTSDLPLTTIGWGDLQATVNGLRFTKTHVVINFTNSRGYAPDLIMLDGDGNCRTRNGILKEVVNKNGDTFDVRYTIQGVPELTNESYCKLEKVKSFTFSFGEGILVLANPKYTGK